MKKHYNAFKAARVTNTLRILGLVCGLGVLLVIIFYFSVAENRKGIAGWFGIKAPQINTQETQTANQTKDAGISGTVAVNQNINVRPIDQTDHLWGPIDAPVKLIVYDDFECPFCAQLYETINQAKAEFGTNLVVAVRHFPLVSHEQAIPAAEAAECAGGQNKFWEMYHALYEDNKANRLKTEAYTNDAQAIGLDMKAFTLCLTAKKYNDKILAEKAEVKDLGVIGTPASFLNNQYLPGALPYEDFSYPDGKAALGLRSLIQQKLNASR